MSQDLARVKTIPSVLYQTIHCDMDSGKAKSRFMLSHLPDDANWEQLQFYLLGLLRYVSSLPYSEARYFPAV